MYLFFAIAFCVCATVSSGVAKKQKHSDNHESESNHVAIEAIYNDGHESGAHGGFSAGSGLRIIAQGSAEQANNAFLNQHAAARQAAFAAKSALAQTASGASATARAALVGKFILLQRLEQEVQEALQNLESETQQLTQAERAAASAQTLEQLAQQHVNAINAAINTARGTAAHAQEAANAAIGEFGTQTAMFGKAKGRLATAAERLSSAQVDYKATRAAAQQASDAALLAQSNASQAAEKASSSFQQGTIGAHYHVSDEASGYH